MIVTKEGLIAFAQACIYVKDWESGGSLFWLGWIHGRNETSLQPYIDAAIADSQRYRKRQGRASVFDRRQFAHWAQRYLEENGCAPISWRADE